MNKEEQQKVAHMLITPIIGKFALARKNISKMDVYDIPCPTGIMVGATLWSNVPWDDIDKEILSSNLLPIFENVQIKVVGDKLYAMATYNPPSKKKVAKKPITKDNQQLKKAIWAMQEMYDCLIGFMSEQGKGFAETMVKDENKMLNEAENGIKYLKSILKKRK